MSLPHHGPSGQAAAGTSNKRPGLPRLDEPFRWTLSVADVATLLGISERHLWTLNATGRLPAPIRLGKAVRWSTAELRDWLQAGAPTEPPGKQQKGTGNDRHPARRPWLSRPGLVRSANPSNGEQ